MSATAGPLAVLGRAFNPRTIAVIGASAQPQKFGYKLVEHLVTGGFSGRIYPVNPRSMPILGLPTYPSLAEVPGPVDVAALLVPAEATPAAVSECAAKGVSVAVIITSGFAESSPAGAQAQAGMSAVARAAGMRIVGPNCEGIVNLHGGLVLSFSQMFLGQRPGPISLVSQSGAYCGIVSSRLSRAGVGTAKIVSSGNEGDLAAVDYLEYLDPPWAARAGQPARAHRDADERRRAEPPHRAPRPVLRGARARRHRAHRPLRGRRALAVHAPGALVPERVAPEGRAD